MTALPASSLGADRRAPVLRLDSVAVATAIVFPLALVLSWPKIVAVWQTGVFYDPDDAMRMVEVRDWLAGQGWFDLVAHRLDPPAGVFMHWSRVVDVPLGALVRLFGLVLDPVGAERLARLVFPLALQGAMIAATASTARALAGPRAVLPAAILILLSGISFDQFQPGRIDHHAPQILLLMLAVGAILRALDGAWRGAALAGGLLALSFAISLENLPFAAVLLAALPIAWVVRGDRARLVLAAQGASVALCGAALFLATVGPARYGIAACDSFSIAHLAPLLTGACGLGVLAMLSPRLRSRAGRGAALAAVGLAAMASLAAVAPACLGDPYAHLDPEVAELWLHRVAEAQPIVRLARTDHELVLTTIVPLAACFVAVLAGLWRHRRSAPAAWLLTAALVAMGVAGTFWQVRVASSLMPLALLGAAWAAAAALERAQASGRFVDALPPFAVIGASSSLLWAMVPLPGAASPAPGDAGACRTGDAMAPLAALHDGPVFAPIDAGSHLLAYTPLAVFAAPYHRDGHGLRLVLDGFMAPAGRARELIEGTGARTLLFCLSDPQLARAATDAPDGLAADLLAGRVPSWLVPIDVGASPYRAYRVE